MRGLVVKLHSPNLAAIGLLSLLTACANQPVAVDTAIEVPVPCRVATPAKPSLPLDDAAAYTEDDGNISLDRFAAAALATHFLWQGYAGQLEAALATCKYLP